MSADMDTKTVSCVNDKCPNFEKKYKMEGCPLEPV